MTGPGSDDLVAFLKARLDEDEAAGRLHERGPVWYEMPLPRRWHRCRPAQSGYIHTGAFYERCACGAIRRNGHPWLERNSRRKSERS